MLATIDVGNRAYTSHAGLPVLYGRSITDINVESCYYLYIMSTATDQKPQSHKKVIYTTIRSLECQCDAE